MALTKAICNKVFSDNSSILPRSNFGACGQESSPQSLTAYSLNRWRQAYYDTTQQKMTVKQRRKSKPFLKDSHRTASTFAFFPTHKPTQKMQKSLLLPTHPSPPTTLTQYEWISREKRVDNNIKF